MSKIGTTSMLANNKASQIFVKAKTHEKLGPIGRGKGIEAHVVCLLEKSEA